MDDQRQQQAKGKRSLFRKWTLTASKLFSIKKPTKPKAQAEAEADPTIAQLTLSEASAFKVSQDLQCIVEEEDGLNAEAASMVESDVVQAMQLIASHRKCQIGKVLERVQQAEQLYLAFLVDTTGSMYNHIAGVKQQIHAICANIKSATKVHTNQPKPAKVSVAFVGYKDFYDGPNHFQVFSFSQDLVAFQRFVDRISVTGGGDASEDVNGGLQQVLKALKWQPLCTNVVFHLGDAPPHGKQYGNGSDFESLASSKRYDVPIQTIFAEFREKNIEYYFGKINDTTNRMIQVFTRAKGSAIECFNIRDPIDITKSVASASLESLVTRAKEATAAVGAAEGSSKIRKLKLPVVLQDPRWDKLPVLGGEIFGYERPLTMQVIYDYVELTQEPVSMGQFRIAPVPFAEGSMRFAFYGRQYFNKTKVQANEPFELIKGRVVGVTNQVFKVFKLNTKHSCSCSSSSADKSSIDRMDRYRYFVSMEVQTIARFLADQFMNSLPASESRDERFSLAFVQSKVVRMELKDGSFKYFSMENNLSTGATPLDQEQDKWVKVTNNFGSVLRTMERGLDQTFAEYLMAFAHWTYEFSHGYLLVTDLQGYITENEDSNTPFIVLTDPAIHSHHVTRFGRTNLGQVGMKRFFESHKCNHFCHALKLRKSDGMLYLNFAAAMKQLQVHRQEV